jgi:hypothetical protein
MVNNFFLSSCAKLGWGHHFSLSFFWHFFFPFKDPKNAVPFVERIFFKKCQMKKNKNKFKQVIKIWQDY